MATRGPGSRRPKGGTLDENKLDQIVAKARREADTWGKREDERVSAGITGRGPRLPVHRPGLPPLPRPPPGHPSGRGRQRPDADDADGRQYRRETPPTRPASSSCAVRKSPGA